MKINHKLAALAKKMQGELRYDDLHRHIYATDASVYRIVPEAVAYPAGKEDIRLLIDYARENRIPLVPRTAGTSLGGQVVGEGIIVDVSRHMNRIIEINPREKWALVQPGVIRDDLNRAVAPYGLWFSPNTSTANRCMIGGMTGNNSSGSTSIRYGVTRDKVMEIEGFLSDGTFLKFGPLSKEAFNDKLQSENKREREIYRFIRDTFTHPEVQEEIRRNMPKLTIHRRNTGYALETLINNEVFSRDYPGVSFNLAKLLTGSEGTLFFSTAVKIRLDELPPKRRLMVTAHFRDIIESMEAVAPAMEFELYQCELMDKTILDCTKDSPKYKHYRDWIHGDPQAVLMLEFRGEDMADLERQADEMIGRLQKLGLSYAFHKLYDDDAAKAEELRKAGLGLLGNLPGDEKAVPGTEDTAVDIHDLPAYIDEFRRLMESKGKKPVYFAHAGAGEIHLRPILNLKKKSGVKLFRELVSSVADLVHKYKGSLSGEHGDGFIRAEFIPKIVGEKNYELMRQIKSVFDPDNLFNPHKIVDPYPMDSHLRYKAGRKEPEIPTLTRFVKEGGILRAAEKCNGSGDCRKPPEAGGVMCPSYQATREEKNTTRARANALREFLTRHYEQNKTGNPFNYEELYETLSLCLSCKACKSECPSTVDMAALKAEFLYQWQETNGYTLRNRFFAYSGKINRFFAKIPFVYNAGVRLAAPLVKKFLGIAPQRKLPRLSNVSLRTWFEHQGGKNFPGEHAKKSVYLFADEFIDTMDSETGQAVVKVLTALGYEVMLVPHADSGRSYISKGFLKQAKRLANENIRFFDGIVNEETPLIGIEPSAVLTFRDEYPRLVDEDLVEKAEELSKHVYLFEEFLYDEWKAGRISGNDFNDTEKHIQLHVHCHHKALSDQEKVKAVLSIPKNYRVELLDSGCCGMAGSFGYEKEHYDLSLKIGELKLFPALREAAPGTVIAANGISCRHQIDDVLHKEAVHPAVLLLEALKKS